MAALASQRDRRGRGAGSHAVRRSLARPRDERSNGFAEVVRGVAALSLPCFGAFLLLVFLCSERHFAIGFLTAVLLQVVWLVALFRRHGPCEPIAFQLGLFLAAAAGAYFDLVVVVLALSETRCFPR
ncbi:MAG: hypothetical protein HZA53_12145 [Planctomycetes bacterium]|nr:hypothetical protein [Planctomycetota bacterium]